MNPTQKQTLARSRRLADEIRRDRQVRDAAPKLLAVAEEILNRFGGHLQHIAPFGPQVHDRLAAAVREAKR